MTFLYTVPKYPVHLRLKITAQSRHLNNPDLALSLNTLNFAI